MRKKRWPSVKNMLGYHSWSRQMGRAIRLREMYGEGVRFALRRPKLFSHFSNGLITITSIPRGNNRREGRGRGGGGT